MELNMPDTTPAAGTPATNPADAKPAASTATQAMPQDGLKGAADGTNRPDENPGESGGGAYPNPHTGSEGKGDQEWHGGQSETAYHGPEQLGDEEIKPGGNQNAGSKK
jgi:hypothetical protein